MNKVTGKFLSADCNEFQFKMKRHYFLTDFLFKGILIDSSCRKIAFHAA